MPREINPAIDAAREKGSKVILREINDKDYLTLPAASLMKAAGVIESVGGKRKPIVTVINSYTNQIPGHAHLDKIEEIVVKQLEEDGFDVFRASVGNCVCDGIPMGTEFSMNYSLPSRESIADQVEGILGAKPVDGVITIGNCDKIVPGMLNGMTRVNIPSLYISGGPMLAGECEGCSHDIDLVTIFQDIAKVNSGDMSVDEAIKRAEKADPGFGSCAGMFTANTENSLAEVIGFAAPGNGTIPAGKIIDGKYVLNPDRVEYTRNAAALLKSIIANDLRPSDLVTKDSLDNVFKADKAVGGSTNTILHFLSLAHEAGVPYTLEDIERADAPNISKIAPSRPEVHIQDFHKAGGMSSIIMELYRKGIFKKGTRSVTGKTVDENVKGALAPDGDIIRTVDNPFSETGGLKVVYGNIAPNGSVVKTAGVPEDMMKGTYKMKIYNSQIEAYNGILNGEIEDGMCIGILYEGPKGGPGMQEMLSPTALLVEMGVKASLITDGRFSGGTKGACIGHVSPEAAAKGPIAALQDGDIIDIDLYEGVMNVRLSEDEIADRISKLPEFEPRAKGGSLRRYSYLVDSADKGAVLRDPYQK